MKKSDIVSVVFIAIVSMVLACFVARFIFGDNVYNLSSKVKTIEKIESNVEDPSPSIFNKDAINPTVQVEIVKPTGSK